MDKTDLNIIKILLDNSKISYKDISDKVGLNYNSIRNRVKKMLDNGIIRYNILINLVNFGYDIIHIMVKQVDDLESLVNKIRLLGNVYILVKCINATYIIGISLKNRENSLELIKALLDPLKPTIISYRTNSPIKLSQTQIKIIRYLLLKPSSSNKEIALALNISPKTVKRNLDYLIKNAIIRFSILLDPSKLESYINVGMIIRLNKNDDINKIYQILQNNFLMKPIVYEDIMLVILYTNNISWIDECYRNIRNIGIKDIEALIALDVKISLDWFIDNLKSMIRER